MERSSIIFQLSSSNKIVVNICFSEKKTLQKTVFGCHCSVSVLGPGKVSLETLTPKRARNSRYGTQSPKVERSRNYGTELNHRCWESQLPIPSPVPPLSHIILFSWACYTGYTQRVLHGKCLRTVFSYEFSVDASEIERVSSLKE